ncbi:type II secretion system minor pseudopilin GspK [Desulfohalobiaceae bacterium Ax17]|uniref:type II secretion system minor pseudopilin GspK n=1 Tax=Desulfovulcanus ferrireducens TaxID=2831190 RepID=UPI00207BCDD5|nr:type II secretion system minor pseudopilin GspK [Desulfovulcanus ferrireducens]MBT8762573.1 type II secretion system minor pseudopilin GspK [Desulfovulcanus ferrireducens]
MGIRKKLEQKNGSVLILTLLIITILVTIVLETQSKNRVYLTSTIYMARKERCRALARSGLALAKALLTYDRAQDNESDHPGEIWAHPDEQDGLDLPAPERGQILLQIADEQAKFSINYLIDSRGRWREEYRQAFFNLLIGPAFHLDPEKAQNIIIAIKDWLDSDELPESEAGFEQDYYDQNKKKIRVRNGPIQTLSELRHIAGISDSLYFGDSGRPGLKELLTIFSDGKVNINTAPQYILASLIKQGDTGVPAEDALDFAQEMIEYRQDRMHFDKLSSSGWYNNLPGALGIHFYSFITIKSRYFSVLSTGKLGQTEVKVRAILKLKTQQNKKKIKFIPLFVEYS